MGLMYVNERGVRGHSPTVQPTKSAESAINETTILTVRQMAKSAASLRRPHLLCRWNKPLSFV